MEISIQKGEGVSQAIKRQLIAEGIQENQFTGSIWSKIHSALKDDTSTIKHNGNEQKIGDLWVELGSNVKTYVNDELNILEATWKKIIGFFTKSNNGTQTSTTKKGSGSTNNTASTGNKDAQENEIKAALKARVKQKNEKHKKANLELEAAEALLAKASVMTEKNNKMYKGHNDDNNSDYYVIDMNDDGTQWIEVRKYPNNGTVEVAVSTKEDSGNENASEVLYSFDKDGKCKIWVDTDDTNDEYEVNFDKRDAGYADKMKPVIKAIFGDEIDW